jgi:hypothetical protein
VARYPFLSKIPIGTKVLSGTKCPEGGEWQSQTDFPEIIDVLQGEIMPLLRTKRVKWKLISYF